MELTFWEKLKYKYDWLGIAVYFAIGIGIVSFLVCGMIWWSSGHHINATETEKKWFWYVIGIAVTVKWICIDPIVDKLGDLIKSVNKIERAIPYKYED